MVNEMSHKFETIKTKANASMKSKVNNIWSLINIIKANLLTKEIWGGVRCGRNDKLRYATRIKKPIR